MPTSPSVELRGAQEPSVWWAPPAPSSSGAEAIELARVAGLHLDPWQEFVLERALREKTDGLWAAMEVGVMVSRQNGKGGILEARELAGLFLLGEQLITHSAHQFDTSLEAFRRLLFLIEDTPDLDQRVKRVSRSHGEEGIELKGGQRIRFRTRTKGGGRGFTGDCVILDEAMILPESSHGALMPTLSARPNPQLWYTGSAVDQNIHEHGVVFARVRERGHAGEDPELAWFEWAAGADLEAAEALATDPEAWAAGNPALGIRITPGFVSLEQRSMAARTFAVERLGIGDWPDTGDAAGQVIKLDDWELLKDEQSKRTGQVCFALDVSPDRAWSSIGLAGHRADKLRHVELIDRRRGTSWVVERLEQLTREHNAQPVELDATSPAASLIGKLEDAGVRVHTVSAQEHAQACGGIFDAVTDRTFRHIGQPELTAAIKGAVKRPLGDAWAWSRKSSAVDISPLVACTLALRGLDSETYKEPLFAWA